MAEEESNGGRVEKKMEGVASIALLPSGSISGHFIQLPHSICYGLQGTELACERECSRGEDYRLVKLTIIDYIVGLLCISCLFFFFELVKWYFLSLSIFICWWPFHYNRERKNKLWLWSVGVMMLLDCVALIMLMGSWEKDIVGMVEQKHGKHKISVSFECETLKADTAAEDHIRQFMPKLAGLDAVVNIGRMSIIGVGSEAEE